jgi:LPS-assembly lipoprotein
MKAQGTGHRAQGRSSKNSFCLVPYAFCLAASLLLAGCGFQLRGTAPMPFESIYVRAAESSQFASQLKRAVRAGSGARLTDRPDDAQVILQVLNELQERQILSLTGGGRVSEFRLRYRVSFRLTDSQNREHIPATEIVMRRDYSYSDDQALSKDAEEALLYRDMRTDAVQQIVRRLQSARLRS